MKTEKLEKDLISLRREALRSFHDFRRYYFASVNVIPDAKFHYNICNILVKITDERGQKWAIAAPRGSGKSAIITTQYVIYVLCLGLEKFIVIISSTREQAAGYLQSIKEQLQYNTKLLRDFPEICEIKPKPPRWTQYEVQTKNRVRITVLGSDQQIRERKNDDTRPTLIIIDDVEGDHDLLTPEAYKKSHDWLTKAVLKSGTPKTNIILTGTIHNYNSLLAQFTNSNENPGWKKKISRMVMSWPENMTLWESWQKIFHYQMAFEGIEGPEGALAFYKANEEAMLKGIKILWPQRYTYYELMVMREQDGYPSFDSEMQNQPVDPADCLFNLDELHYWDNQFDSVEQLVRGIGSHPEFYGACDPSLGRQNRRGDYSAIVNVVRSSKTGRIYILDADIQRRLPDKILSDILQYFRIRRFRKFAFESNQFQEYMAGHLQTMGNVAGLYPVIEQIHNTKNKLGRIGGLQALVKSGTILFSKKHRLLLDQLKFFPKGMHDDGLDALEMAVRLCKEPVVEPRMWLI